MEEDTLYYFDDAEFRRLAEVLPELNDAIATP